MEISPLPRTMRVDDLPLEQLAHNSKLSETEKIGELSRQFEAVLLRQILGEAQKTVIKSSLTDESATRGIYQDMISNQLADTISKTGSFGLARSLQAELTRQLVKPKTGEAK
ncbi:MAG TPA: rod-binding protein [Verrucomicrobiae bacterium]|jgi:Rod binding domain-containing protein